MADSPAIDAGDAVNIYDVQLEDSIDASDNSTVNVYGGTIEGSVSMLDSSVANIFGGNFPNIFSNGEGLQALGSTINVTGGLFGQPGVDDGGSALASLGGVLDFNGGVIAGVDTGDAPTASFSAVLNGQINLSNATFGNLKLEAGNNGVLTASMYTAEKVEVNAIGGGTVNLLGSGADELAITTQLAGVVNLIGGQFGSISATLMSQGVLNVRGHSFSFNNVPLENVDDVFGPGGYDESTGEIRFVAGSLAGILANGENFKMSFTRFATQGAKLFVEMVPEPGCGVLGIGLLLTLCGRRGNSPWFA